MSKFMSKSMIILALLAIVLSACGPTPTTQAPANYYRRRRSRRYNRMVLRHEDRFLPRWAVWRSFCDSRL
jgi:uncharacterized lipoprotein